MDHTQAHSRNTKLNDRTLWFDGDSSFDAKKLNVLSKFYTIKFVDEMTDEVRQYNQHVTKEKEIRVKKDCGDIHVNWTYPAKLKDFDVFEFLCELHEITLEGVSKDEMAKRDRRLAQEYVRYKKHGLEDALRAFIWIINNLERNGTVWGIGRGSSVSSYLLYIIGVHDVDSFAYGLSLDDFLHE